MGRHLHQESSGIEFQDHHWGCLWGILHILDHHHRNNEKKILPLKKHHGRRRAICCANPKTISMDRDTGEAQMSLDDEADNFLAKQHATKVSPINNNASKACIKALITEEMSKEENHEHWFLGFHAQPKFLRTDSIPHLEPSDYRLGKIGTDWASPIIVLHKNANPSASGVQLSSLKKTSGRLVATNINSDFCDSVNAEGSLGQYQRSGKHAVVKSDGVMETSKSQQQMDAKHLNREVFHDQVKEYADVLEIFKVNKELFIKILQDPDTGLQISNRKAKLTKSGSFPVADMSRGRFLRPSTLEHKQNEVWTFSKAEKLASSAQVPKPDADRSQNGYDEKTLPSLTDESIGSVRKHRNGISSQGLSQVSNHHSWNHLVIGRLRNIKQRIKHAIKEGKKEKNKSNTNGFLQRVPSTRTPSIDGKEMPKSSVNISMSQDISDNNMNSDETYSSDHDLSSSKLHCMRRTTSLNESLDRYAQLFETSFSREQKLPHSKSLKLRNEDNTSSREHAPKFFRRISSLSALESISSLLNEVAGDSEKAARTEVDCNTNTGSYTRSETKSSIFSLDADKSGPLDTVEETELQKNTGKGRDGNASTEYSGGLMVSGTDEKLAENMVETAKITNIPREDQEIDSPMNPAANLPKPSLVSEPQTCFPDHIMNNAECPISEGSKYGSTHISEADSSLVMQNAANKDSLPSLYGKVNHEQGTHFLHFELDNDEASFNYVRDVLKLSGFIESESLGKWYSLDQPLDPSLFQEMETYLHHEVQFSEEFDGNCCHRLLFDLINEVLLEMYERSFTYFPRGFSFNHRIRPMPKGHRVLEEVWSRICGYQSFRSELDQSLDDLVAKDLAKGDGWMNHQFETECIALELEDLIFDELLDEVIWS